MQMTVPRLMVVSVVMVIVMILRRIQSNGMGISAYKPDCSVSFYGRFKYCMLKKNYNLNRVISIK